MWKLFFYHFCGVFYFFWVPTRKNISVVDRKQTKEILTKLTSVFYHFTEWKRPFCRYLQISFVVIIIYELFWPWKGYFLCIYSCKCWLMTVKIEIMVEHLTVILNHFVFWKVVFSTLTKLFFSCWAIFWPQYIHLRVYAALKVDNCPIVFFCLNLTLWNQRVCYLKFLLSFIGSIWALIWDF